MIGTETQKTTRSQKQADALADMVNAGKIAAVGPGILGKTAGEVESATTSGLELGNIQLMPIDWFRPNPENDVFRALKSDEYFSALKRDIAEARAIISPLIAMPDGLLIEGESRLTLTRELLAEGMTEFARLPVRMVLSPLTPEEQRQRLYLGNLSRFEIDGDTRAILFGRIWPGYFFAARPGRPPKEEAGNAPTREQIAAATGLSEAQVKREAGLLRKAADIAEGEGRKEPSAADVKAARQAANAERKERKPVPDKRPDEPPAKAQKPHPDGEPAPEPTQEPAKPSAKAARWKAMRSEIEGELLVGTEGEYRDGVQDTLEAIERRILAN